MDYNAEKHTKENYPWEWFLDFAGVGMCHNFYVHHLFSKIIDANPQIERIVEFGTYWGSMTTALALEGLRKKIPFHTFEITEQRKPEIIELHQKLNVLDFIGDIFEKSLKEFIASRLKLSQAFLVCDNGDKAREFKEYVPMLKSGSIMAVHDYMTEFYDADWKVHENLVEPIMQDEWLKHNAQLCIFKVK